MFPKGQLDRIQSDAVKGTQNTTNNRSAIAKFMINMFVVERINGFPATTGNAK